MQSLFGVLAALFLLDGATPACDGFGDYEPEKHVDMCRD
jgi:hypothetical protein